MDWLNKIIKKAQGFRIGKKVCLGLDVLETSFPQYLLLKEHANNLTLLDCGRVLDMHSDCNRLRKMANSVTVAIPRDKMILRVLQVSYSDPKKLMESVIEEAQHSLPFRLTDLAWQYSVVQSDDSSAQVVFAAVEKKMVNEYKKRLQTMGFKNVDMTVSTLAYLNCFLYNYQDSLRGQNHLLLDIGMRQIEICILAEGNIVFTRSLNLGAEYILRLIAEYLNVDFATAQSIMFASKNVSELEGENNESRLREAFNVWIERLIKEVELASRFFTTKFGENTSRIVMSGCSFDLTYDRDYIAEVLRNHFKKDVDFLDPMMNAVLDAQSSLNTKDLQDNAMIVSMGLALQSTEHAKYQINFNHKVISETNSKSNRAGLQKIIVIVSVILLIFSVFNIVSTRNNKSKYTQIKKDYSKKNNQLRIARAKQKKIKKTLDEIHMKPSVLIDLKMFVENLPLNMIITDIELKHGFLNAHGYLNEKIAVEPYSNIQQKLMQNMQVKEPSENQSQPLFMKPFVLTLGGDVS